MQLLYCYLKRFLAFLMILTFLGLAPVYDANAALDNKGTDFILGFLPNYSTGNVELHLTGNEATNVTIHYPVNSPTFTTTVAVIPGDVTIVSLPTTAMSAWSNGTVGNNCVRAFSDKEFVCYMINRASATSDASLAIPIDTFNTEYFTVNNPDIQSSYEYAEFVVFAAYDGTSIEIKLPSSSTVLTATLNHGEGYFYTTSTAIDLTGTFISASKPVGVTSGNRCVNYDGSACDHIFEMLPPIAAWEKEIPAVNPPETSLGVHYSILASTDGTAVTANGAAVASLDKGQSFYTGRLADNYIFEANEPIMVAQFLANRGTSGGDPIGDPAMGILTPTEQFDSSYTFSTVGGAQFAENNVTIVAETSDVGNLLLDGIAIPAAQYSEIDSSGLWATVQYLTDGVHTTSSTMPHGINVMGFHSYDSYLYTGGALFEFVNPQGDTNPPVCNCDENTHTCTATDDRPSEDVNGNGVLDPGEDLNGNGLIDKDRGIFFVELAAGSQNLALTVDPFVPGDPIVTYSYAKIDPALEAAGIIVVKDGSGNICETQISIPGEGVICGDLDGDGDVDGADRIILMGAFRSCIGNVKYIEAADYNQDGCINFFDYQLWYQCYKDYITP